MSCLVCRTAGRHRSAFAKRRCAGADTGRTRASPRAFVRASRRVKSASAHRRLSRRTLSCDVMSQVIRTPGPTGESAWEAPTADERAPVLGGTPRASRRARECVTPPRAKRAETSGCLEYGAFRCASCLWLPARRALGKNATKVFLRRREPLTEFRPPRHGSSRDARWKFFVTPEPMPKRSVHIKTFWKPRSRLTNLFFDRRKSHDASRVAPHSTAGASTGDGPAVVVTWGSGVRMGSGRTAARRATRAPTANAETAAWPASAARMVSSSGSARSAGRVRTAG